MGSIVASLAAAPARAETPAPLPGAAAQPPAAETGQLPALELLPPDADALGGPSRAPERYLHPTDLPLGGLPDPPPGGDPAPDASLAAPGSAPAAAAPPAVARDPNTAAAELYARQALRRAGAGDFDLALGLLENAIRLAPRDFRLYISLGNVLLRAGRLAEARQAYEAALVAAPQSQLAASNYAAALAAQGHPIRALYILQTAEKRRPGHPLVRANLGSVHALLGNDDAAIREWSGLARTDPALLRLTLEDPLLIEPLRRPRLSRFRLELTAGHLLSGSPPSSGAPEPHPAGWILSDPGLPVQEKR